MTKSVLNKIAGGGLILLIITAAVDVCVLIIKRNDVLSAVPLSYRIIMTVCCWGGAALVGTIIYLVAKRFVKGRKGN